MVVPWGIEPALKDEHAGTEVADRVYWFGANMVNWYLLADEDRLTIVDAGLPAHWELLGEGLDTLGYELSDVDALILTHADPDHIGFAERLRENGVPVWVHEADYDAALSGGDALPLRTLLHIWRPPLLGFLRSTMGAGSGSTQEIFEAQTFTGGEELTVPGQPTAIHLPGHTDGQCAFWLPDRHVLFVGDALTMMDHLRGTECEPVMMELANTDDDEAAESIRNLIGFEEVTLRPGHGRPWDGHLGDALAREIEE